MEAKVAGISKLKIVSDGTSMGTRVILNGKEIQGIISKVEWWISAESGIAEARVTFNNVEAKLIGDTIIQTIKTLGYQDDLE